MRRRRLRYRIYAQGHGSKSPQEYQGPLPVLGGEEYSRIPFADLHERICDRLRGNRAPIVAEILLPDSTTKILRRRYGAGP